MTAFRPISEAACSWSDDNYAYKILTELAAVAEVAGRTLACATRLVAGVMHYARSAVLTLTRHTRILYTHAHVHARAHTRAAFYHLLPARCYASGTSHGPVSVRPSVTSRSSTKTAERIELVFGV